MLAWLLLRYALNCVLLLHPHQAMFTVTFIFGFDMRNEGNTVSSRPIRQSCL